MRDEKDKVAKERDVFCQVLEELPSKVECPVCLAVPTAGPVPMCPQGCNRHVGLRLLPGPHGRGGHVPAYHGGHRECEA